MALKTADYGYVLEVGRIVLEGPCAKLMETDDIKEFYLGQKDAGLHQGIGNLTGPCDGGGGPARSGIPQGHADIVFESQGELGANTPTHEPGPDDGDAVDHSRWSTHGSECTAVADLVSGQGETGTHGMDGYRTRWRTRRRHVTMARC